MMRSESSNYKLGHLEKDCVETHQGTDPDINFQMVRGRTIKMVLDHKLQNSNARTRYQFIEI